MIQFLAGVILVLAMAMWVVYRTGKDKGLFLQGLVLGLAYAYVADPIKAGMLVGAVIAAVAIAVMACMSINKNE